MFNDFKLFLQKKKKNPKTIITTRFSSILDKERSELKNPDFLCLPNEYAKVKFALRASEAAPCGAVKYCGCAAK